VFTGSGVQTHYAAMKAAVHNLMQSLAIILGPYGITCNSVAPALIATDMNREELADDVRRNAVLQRTPVRRVGEPRDLAAAYLYFASDDSSFTTGSYLRIDGGLLLEV
jgi:L-rhamnose 1-dehydrogenase